MKSGMPWSIRGIDDEAREAARAAARQAGLSVSEWLNDLIAEKASEQGVLPVVDEADESDADDRAVAAAVERLTARIRAMDETSRSTLSGLKDRLDDIEGRLGALPGMRRGSRERAGSVKDVSAVIEKLSRELDGVDERARTMIEGLRGRAGATLRNPALDNVGNAIRELDQRISSMGERAKAPPAMGATASFEELKNRLDELLAKAPPPPQPPSRSLSPDTTLRSLEARIDAARARLVGTNRVPAETGDNRMRRIEARLADIAGYLDQRETTGTKPQPRRGDDLASAIAQISARQRMLDTPPDVFGTPNLSDALATLHADIAGLAGKMAAFGRGGAEDQGAFYDLVRRIDALATERPHERNQQSAMRADLEALRAAIEGGSAGPGLMSRLDSLLERTPDRGRLDALGEEVSAMRRALEAADNPRAMARLEMRVAELARSVEAALNAEGNARRRSESEGLARFETILNEVAARIDGLLDRATPGNAIAEVHDRIAALAERFDSIDAIQHGPTATLDEIKSELVAIRREMAGRETPPRNDRLESQVADLARRLDAVAASGSNEEGLAALEAQMTHLAGELERAAPRGVELKHVEESLARLQTILAEGRDQSMEAARAAAREAVDEMAGGRIDSDILKALREDLKNVRRVAGSAEDHSREAMGSVEDTLSTVVDRLSRLEASERSETAEPVTGTYGGEALIARADPAGMRTSTRAANPRDEHRPLEPGSGKPDLAALRELAGNSPNAPREGKAGDRKADFIAAARRAAQAAAAESALASDADGTPDKPKQGPFARIGQAIRSRRRPLLLAAAAIVLAIGALQLFGERISGIGASADGEPLIAAVESDATAADPASARRVPGADPVAAIVPQVSQPAMVAPLADGGAALAFAEPETFGNRFGSASAAPVASGFSTPDDRHPAGTQTASLGAVPESAAPVAVAPLPDAAIGSERLLDAAASGDPSAAFEVAVRYAEGRGVPADLAKASAWYARAAEGGIAVAQYRLGSLYERGQGVQKDLAAAVTWYQRAADQGNVGAMHNLAVLMSEGIEGTPDHAKALQWFLTAADYGVKDSQYNLGVIYARGLGVETSLPDAYKWFAIAAAQGDADGASRRDDVAKIMTPDDLAKGRALVQAWHPKPALPEANAVTVPDGGWEQPVGKVTEADRRQLVMKIQALLAEQGYDVGAADGLEGPKTRQAVRAFQKTVGIAETGAISNALVAALSAPTD